MYRYRWIIVLLVLLSVSILVSSTWFDRAGWDTWRALQRESHPRPYGRQPLLETSPFLSSLAALLTFAFSGVLTLFLLPDHINGMQAALSSSLGKLVRLTLLGALTGLFISVVILSAALTLGTFPITILLASALFLSAFVGFIALVYTLGQELLKRAGWANLSPIVAFLLGLVILFGLGSAPFVGIIFQLLLGGLSLGAVIATRFGSGEPWSLNQLRDRESL